jgi:hypothetical protein
MQIPVFVEPIDNQGYRASGAPGFAFVAQGASADKALGRFHAEIERRIAEGAILVNLEVRTAEENPWIECAGSLEDDRFYEAWQREIAEYRRQVNECPGDPSFLISELAAW